MKTISIDHLARVEGAGGIAATIDGNVVTDVRFNINEGPRLVEKLTVGRTPEEDVSMSPRICAICSVSHKNGVLRAMENALDVKISQKSYLLRELMHMGEFIESHALHTFYLALPDFLGFPNAIAMAADYELEVKIALEMKHFGNHLMKTLNGRFIHGENAVIGGFGKYPSKEELLWIKQRAIHFMPFVFKTVDLFCGIDYPDSPDSPTLFACCEPGDGKFGFWGDEIVLSTGEKIQRDDYKNLTNEFVVSHSFAKRSRYNGEPYSVGALARIAILGDRLDGEAGKMYEKYYKPHWKDNPFYHTPARSLEIMYSFERIPALVDEILKNEENSSVVDYSLKNGKGTGLVEAPRGLLIHHHEVTDGLVSGVDIITPTAQNAEDIERYCHTAAQKLLDDGKEDQIRDRIDMVVRAFDPCISCSAHMVEVQKAPEDNWKIQLENIAALGNPVFIGVGNEKLSDDGVGIELARRLRKAGVKDVLLESEIEEDETLWAFESNRPTLFLDAVNFQQAPGKVTVLPMNLVLNNAALSHRFLPIVSGMLNYEQLKNAFVVGIQPETIEEGNSISESAAQAMDVIYDFLLV
jgi:sulfhydrogenase subunit alpha